MANNDLSWTDASNELEGQGFERFQIELANYNARHLMPAFPTDTWRDEVEEFAQVTRAEGEYIETVRREVSPLLANVPSGVDDFIDWFEELKRTGPGQGDELFPWLAQNASREEHALVFDPRGRR